MLTHVVIYRKCTQLYAYYTGKGGRLIDRNSEPIGRVRSTAPSPFESTTGIRFSVWLVVMRTYFLLLSVVIVTLPSCSWVSMC